MHRQGVPTEVMFVAEGVVQLDDVRMGTARQYIALSEGVLLLLLFDQMLLLHLFDRVLLATALVAH